MTEGHGRRTNGEAEGNPEASPEAAAAEENVSTPQTVEDLGAELLRVRAEAEQNWQQFLHAAADLENYKKQAVRAREDAVARTRRAMLGVILVVVDNIERALDYGGQTEASVPIVEGIRMTHRRVLDQLASMGVRPFDAVGKPFDARYHEAVEVVPATEEHPPGTVVAEVERGYLIGQEVLRPARVRVTREA